jgi:hypothetical protein
MSKSSWAILLRNISLLLSAVTPSFLASSLLSVATDNDVVDKCTGGFILVLLFGHDSDGRSSDLDVMVSNNLLGSFPPWFKISCGLFSNIETEATTRAKYVMSRTPQFGLDMICASKQAAVRILPLLVQNRAGYGGHFKRETGGDRSQVEPREVRYPCFNLVGFSGK